MIPIPDKPDCRLSRDNTETLPASPRIPRLARRPPRGRARSARPDHWRSAGAAGAELRPQAGQTKVPRCWKAVSVWRAFGPTIRKRLEVALPKAPRPACGTGTPLGDGGNKRCACLFKALAWNKLAHRAWYQKLETMLTIDCPVLLWVGWMRQQE